MSESRQHWLDRNRPPRVQITYDVETLGATVKQEIPFVMGVLGSFTGTTDPAAGGKKLADRRFVEIDRDNFDQVMGSLGATLDLGSVPLAAVSRKADGTGYDVAPPAAPAQVPVKLAFRTLDDFGPRSVLEQLGAASPTGDVARLMSARQYLSELLVKIQGNTWSTAQVASDAVATLAKAKDQIATVTAKLDAFKAGASGAGAFDAAGFAAADKTAVETARGVYDTALGTGPTAVATLIGAATAASTASLDTAATAVKTVSDQAVAVGAALATALGNLTDTTKKQAAGPPVAAAAAEIAQLGRLSARARAATDVAMRALPAA